MRRIRAFTLIELLVVISIIALLIGILLPALSGARKTANQMRNNTQLRGQHQGCVIYAQSNAYYLPGLQTNGGITPPTLGGLGSTTNDGSVVGSRYWILLAGSFISPQLLLNPADSLSVWSSNAVTTGNHSYCMLVITTNANDAGRQAEWKDNANGAAVLITDRNIGTDNSDANAKSLWTTAAGDWRGSVCWGDNHVGFELSNRLTTTTVYNANKQSNDNLFATTAGVPANTTDNSTSTTSNAYMTTTN